MPCDYNNDGKLDAVDRSIYNAYIYAKVKYGPNPTTAQTQERYDFIYVATGKAGPTSVYWNPDLQCSDFNVSGTCNVIDRNIYNAFIFAKIKYGPNPNILQVQERYDFIYVNTGKAPPTTVVTIPDFICGYSTSSSTEIMSSSSSGKGSLGRLTVNLYDDHNDFIGRYISNANYNIGDDIVFTFTSANFPAVAFPFTSIFESRLPQPYCDNSIITFTFYNGFSSESYSAVYDGGYTYSIVDTNTAVRLVSITINVCADSSSSSSSSGLCPNDISGMTTTLKSADFSVVYDKGLACRINGSINQDNYLALYNGDTTGLPYDDVNKFYGEMNEDTITSNGFISLVINSTTYYTPIYSGSSTTDCCTNVVGTVLSESGNTFVSAGFALIKINGYLFKYIQIYNLL